MGKSEFEITFNRFERMPVGKLISHIAVVERPIEEQLIEAIDNLKESITFGDIMENREIDDSFDELCYIMKSIREMREAEKFSA